MEAPQPSSPDIARKPGGAWYRYWAAAIDGVIVWIPTMVVFGFLASFTVHTLPAGERIGAVGKSSFVSFGGIVLTVLYAVYLTVKNGATIGKSAYGMEVVDTKTGKRLTYKTAGIREATKYLILLIPFVGPLLYVINGLVIAFSKDKRGIHDRIAGTQVVIMSKPWAMKKQLGCAALVIAGLIAALGLVFVITNFVPSV